MKNCLLFITLLALSLTEPKSVGQVIPNRTASSQIEGVYNVRQMTVFMSGKPPQVVNLDKPGSKMSATITAKPKSERYVSLTFSQFQNSTQMLSFSYGDAYLRSTPKGYDLAIDGNKVGMTDGTNLTIDISATDKATGAIRRSLLICKKS